jgi:hypothetical protein
MITKIKGCNRQIMPQSFATCIHSATKVKGKHSTDLLQKKQHIGNMIQVFHSHLFIGVSCSSHK